MRNRVRATLATAAVFAGVTAAAATATVVDKGHLADEPYGFAYDCGFPIEVSGVASGNFRLREGKGDDATAFFSLDRITFSERHTNAQTGEWFTLSGHFANNEVGATRIEGSLFEFRSIKAGPVVTIEDSDGNPVARDVGNLRRTILFDTGGDQEPGGEFVDLVDLRLAGQQATFGKLCDVATALIG